MKIFKIIVVILLACALVGAIGFWKWASQPVEQTITIQEAPDTDTPKPTPVTTNQFKTQAPDGYKIQTNRDTGTRLQLVAIQEAKNGLQVGITVDVLPSGGLSDVGDYKLRVSDDSYDKIESSFQPEGTTLFKHSEAPYDLTMFWTNTGRYASISSSGAASTSQEIEALLEYIVSHWEWL